MMTRQSVSILHIRSDEENSESACLLLQPTDALMTIIPARAFISLSLRTSHINPGMEGLRKRRSRLLWQLPWIEGVTLPLLLFTPLLSPHFSRCLPFRKLFGCSKAKLWSGIQICGCRAEWECTPQSLTVPITVPLTVSQTVPLTVLLRVLVTVPLTVFLTIPQTATLTVLLTVPQTVPLAVPLPLTVPLTVPLAFVLQTHNATFPATWRAISIHEQAEFWAKCGSLPLSFNNSPDVIRVCKWWSVLTGSSCHRYYLISLMVLSDTITTLSTPLISHQRPVRNIFLCT